MEKKSVAATILVIFLSLIFSVIGICFSVFVYSDIKILISKVSIVSASGINVFEDNELTKKVESLKLSDMELGLKPATGELDEETQIPSTINDDGTSEGYYATIYVSAEQNFKIVVKDVVIETKKDQIEANEQRKNIFVSIKDRKNTTKSIENDETELATFENVSETQKLTFFIWLGSLASDALEGSKISFTLEFQSV
jgi:hypothetical protein